MTNKRPNFFICRYPNEESAVSVKALQGRLGSLQGYRRGMMPHLTYAGKLVDRKTRHLNADELNSLIFPLPSTATEPLQLATRGLLLVRSRKQGLLHVAINLEDANNQYGSEVEVFENRFKNNLTYRGLYQSELTPHVTLGKIPDDAITEPVIANLEEALPTSLSFLPISYPEYNENNVNAPDHLRPNIRPRSAAKPTMKIPENFLDSLRKGLESK